MAYMIRHGRRIEIETADTGIVSRQRRGFAMQWVKLPRNWITTLERSTSVNTLKLAHRILWAAYEDKRGNEVVTLSRAIAPEMPSTTRKRAIQELLELRLIVPNERPDNRRALRVRLIY
jgi:hypothetical protein